MCDENLMSINRIMDKVNELIRQGVRIDDCCDTVRSRQVIRTLRVGDFLFLTNNGSTPLARTLPSPIPPNVKTIMNHGQMSVIVHNHSNVRAMFMNGVLVFYATIKLELPQYTNTFSLRAFIDAKLNELGVSGSGVKLVILNRKVQPTMNTGDLSIFGEVSLLNQGEFTGTNPSENGINFQSDLTLFNNGYIRGAGGNGVRGKKGRKGANKEIYKNKIQYHKPSGSACYPKYAAGWGHEVASNGTNIMKYYMAWGGPHGWTSSVKNDWPDFDVWYTDADISSLPPGWRYAFWDPSTKERYNCVDPIGASKGHRWGVKRQKTEVTISIGGAGGAAGTAGVGQSFKTTRRDGGAGGMGGAPSLPGGNRGSRGTDGTDGGTWGVRGGPPGGPAGKAVTGKVHWLNLAADGAGNTQGAVT